MQYPTVDLLGDPVDRNHGGSGRPQHKATDENRRLVAIALAFGRSIDDIALSLGVSLPTLRKHYKGELKAQRALRHRLDMRLLVNLLRESDAGNVSATRELQARLDREDLKAARLAEAASPPAETLGKKAQADLAAKTAHETSSWGSLLQ